MANAEWIEKSKALFMTTYGRYPAVMVEGRGCLLKDADGREYLDCLAGIAVCSLGHCHPAITEAICRQASTLVHVSNLYHTMPQTELAELLINHSFADRVFLANSGAEANEAAIKLARKASPEGKYEIISLAGSFHGRTLATVAATGQSKFHQGFEPLPQGFLHAPFDDIVALEAMITPETCAILCEPLQGEGGVRPLSPEYLVAIRQLCDKHDLLLIFDEIQVGMGRTGTLFAYEQCGVIPDILTLAKALGNGLPIGAMLATESVAKAFEPGSHASTFGGNPVACAAAVTVLRLMLAEGFLGEVRNKGFYLAERLTGLAAKYPAIASPARGLGLIQGLPLAEAWVDQGPAMVNRLFEKGVLLNFAGGKVLRCLPPLIISRVEIDQLIQALDEIFAELSQ
ncbi:MAG TPA: aspartate aminotransferase family protein [Desulfobulbaceae bacterium]|nr:MAG: acetylornithine aminotransferase [Deltaproteobacteria bacterium RIFOXYD12_FULL_53_23]HCC53437.1 aspartate aminotransferase family protein [Desulfobulbaceae bacterium]